MPPAVRTFLQALAMVGAPIRFDDGIGDEEIASNLEAIERDEYVVVRRDPDGKGFDVEITDAGRRAAEAS